MIYSKILQQQLTKEILCLTLPSKLIKRAKKKSNPATDWAEKLKLFYQEDVPLITLAVPNDAWSVLSAQSHMTWCKQKQSYQIPPEIFCFKSNLR